MVNLLSQLHLRTLFKAVSEIEKGMSIASLPRSVLALLDTTRARLAGPIVRDTDAFDQAQIRLGANKMIIEQRRSGFVATNRGNRR